MSDFDEMRLVFKTDAGFLWRCPCGLGAKAPASTAGKARTGARDHINRRHPKAAPPQEPEAARRRGRGRPVAPAGMDGQELVLRAFERSGIAASVFTSREFQQRLGEGLEPGLERLGAKLGRDYGYVDHVVLVRAARLGPAQWLEAVEALERRGQLVIYDLVDVVAPPQQAPVVEDPAAAAAPGLEQGLPSSHAGPQGAASTGERSTSPMSRPAAPMSFTASRHQGQALLIGATAMPEVRCQAYTAPDRRGAYRPCPNWAEHLVVAGEEGAQRARLALCKLHLRTHGDGFDLGRRGGEDLVDFAALPAMHTAVASPEASGGVRPAPPKAWPDLARLRKDAPAAAAPLGQDHPSASS